MPEVTCRPSNSAGSLVTQARIEKPGPTHPQLPPTLSARNCRMAGMRHSTEEHPSTLLSRMTCRKGIVLVVAKVRVMPAPRLGERMHALVRTHRNRGRR